MRKSITLSLLALLTLFFFSSTLSYAQVASIVSFPSGWAGHTFNAGTPDQVRMLHDGVVSSGTQLCFGSSASRNTVRIDASGKFFEVQLNFPGTNRTIDQISFHVNGNTSTAGQHGHFGWSTNGTDWVRGQQFQMPISTAECAHITVAAPTDGNYRFFRIMRNASSTNWAGTLGGGQTIRVLSMSVWTKSTGPATPTIIRTSGANPASVMATTAMTPVVFTYSDVANDANVVFDWFTDNSYTTPASAPAGLTIDKNTTAKTITVSGTPTVVGSYFYKITVNETGGNSIEAVVNVTPFITPAPQIILTTTNNNQQTTAGGTIANIVYTIANATNALVTGLPAGLVGVFDSGTFTISGTVAAEALKGVYNYTVTAAALPGYEGADITATGNIVVKSATAIRICYLVAGTAPSTNDTRMFPMLMNHPDYIVTVRTAASTAPDPTVYDAFDLIILNENVAGVNAEAVALRSVNKPILSFKAYSYGIVGSTRWGWGIANNGLSANSLITVRQPSHPVFNGIALEGNTLSLVNNASGNTVQVNDVTTLPGRSIVVASAPKTDGVMAVAVHDVPAATRGVADAKFILLPIADANYHRMNDILLTMINNAIDYLIHGIQFEAPSLDIAAMSYVGKEGVIDHASNTIYITVPSGTDLSAVIPEITLAGVGTHVTPTTARNFINSRVTPVVYTVSDMISTRQYAVTIEEHSNALSKLLMKGLFLEGTTLRNVNRELVQVFNATGRLIATSRIDIEMSGWSQGIYIIRAESGVMKVSLAK